MSLRKSDDIKPIVFFSSSTSLILLLEQMDSLVPSLDVFIPEEKQGLVVDDGIHLNDDDFNVSSSNSIQSEDPQSR